MVIIRFAVKSVVAGGITYYTVQQSLWSESEHSVKLYGKLYNTVAPYVEKNIPKEVVRELPQLPSTSDITSSIKSLWNRGVINTMKFISQLPMHVSNGIDALLSQPAIKDALTNIQSSSAKPTKTGSQ